MQATAPTPKLNPVLRFVRGVAWFLIIPLVAVLVLTLVGYNAVNQYQTEHNDRIFTGISIGRIDVGNMTADEAKAMLTTNVPASLQQVVTLIHPETGEQWAYQLSELGVSMDYEEAIAAAYAIGRNGDDQAQLTTQIQTWYFGQQFQPTIQIDEAQVDTLVADVAVQLDQPVVEAQLNVQGTDVTFSDGAQGQFVDRDVLAHELRTAVLNLQSAEITIPLKQERPRVDVVATSAEAIQQIIGSPITFYVEKPIDGTDLQPITLTQEQLSSWLLIDYVEDSSGTAQPITTLDETAARSWLAAYASVLHREPVRARFYFDDFTQELVLVSPHETGRELDVEATLSLLIAAATSPNRSVPFVVTEILPLVNSNATGVELGITQEITRARATTYFAGSPPERMANIARSAANFYGIVIAPGEQFSFNDYLGEISEEQGYTRGLIIAGGRTIEGIGGGVCQVSTTIFQSVFWGGFQIDERTPHGYRVHYYEDAYAPDGLENVGMDATVYSPSDENDPSIDFKFTNDTPHHLLIENYYNEGDQSLTFKFYSSDMGRVVERQLEIWNVQDARADEYEYNSEIEGNWLEQVDWAVEGANVLVSRNIINQWGNYKVQGEPFYSEYIPWRNIYQYGDGYVFPAAPVDSAESEN